MPQGLGRRLLLVPARAHVDDEPGRVLEREQLVPIGRRQVEDHAHRLRVPLRRAHASGEGVARGPAAEIARRRVASQAITAAAPAGASCRMSSALRPAIVQ